MGGLFSSFRSKPAQEQPIQEKQPTEEAAPAQKQDTPAQQNPPAKPQAAAGSRPPIDRSIFKQTDKADETIIRVPGQINGNQFVTDKLQRCKVIVHDFCDSMFIDRCEDCDFILCTVRGSIFPRECKNCRFIMVCGQFRCRDCTDCQFFMHVKTGPVVESSTNCKIGCAQVYYPELLEHMQKARIDQAVNLWNDVHDFTPGEGHFSLADNEKLELEINENADQTPLPFTHVHTPGATSFAITVPTNSINEIVTISRSTRIYKMEKQGESIIISAEADSKSDVSSQFEALSPSSINELNE